MALNCFYMKRDDNTGLALGGNKTRKLEFIFGAALAQGADTVRPCLYGARDGWIARYDTHG